MTNKYLEKIAYTLDELRDAEDVGMQGWAESAHHTDPYTNTDEHNIYAANKILQQLGHEHRFPYDHSGRIDANKFLMEVGKVSDTPTGKKGALAGVALGALGGLAVGARYGAPAGFAAGIGGSLLGAAGINKLIGAQAKDQAYNESQVEPVNQYLKNLRR